MTYCRFDGQEIEFEEWAATHPGGVVVNSSPGRLDGKYLKAHRAKCDSFWKYLEARTKYSKHCFDSLAEALEYLHAKGLGTPTFGCTACKVATLEPTANFAVFTERVATLLVEGVSEDPPGNPHPRKTESPGCSGYERDPLVAARILQNAAGKCELCKADAPFRTVRGTAYLEVHHVRRLADLGRDMVDNAVALCPNCHRAAHYSIDAPAISKMLYQMLPRLRLE